MAKLVIKELNSMAQLIHRCVHAWGHCNLLLCFNLGEIPIPRQSAIPKGSGSWLLVLMKLSTGIFIGGKCRNEQR